MGLKGNNLFHYLKAGNALDTQQVNAGSANGNEIKEPWRHGRQIMFILHTIVNGIPASSGLTVKVQGKKRSDGAWENVKDPLNNDLQFTVSKLLDGGEFETNKILAGTIDLNTFDGQTYGSVRLLAANSAATAATIGADYIIGDLLRPLYDDVVDDLWYKQRRGTSGP